MQNNYVSENSQPVLRAVLDLGTFLLPHAAYFDKHPEIIHSCGYVGIDMMIISHA